MSTADLLPAAQNSRLRPGEFCFAIKSAMLICIPKNDIIRESRKGSIVMLKRFKNINIRVLISHLIVTLAYPAVKAYVSESSRLLVFTDAVTIIAYILIIGGIVYSLYLHGDFDISGFFLKRGAKSDENKNFDAYMTDRKEKREAAFNYPLFLGIVYLIAAVVISYCFL